MANSKNLDRLNQGVAIWNKWRRKHYEAKINLGSIDFSGKDLTGIDLYYCDLKNSNFSKAILQGADLSECDLQESSFKTANLFNATLAKSNLDKSDLRYARLMETNLSYTKLTDTRLDHAYLTGANLEGADLTRVILRGAFLYGSNFNRSTLSETNFAFARLQYTIFALTNLSNCIGLNEVVVRSECSIDFQTLEQSRNLSPEFLLKIGLPNNYINYLPDFYDESPLRLFPVFLSHSWANKDFAKKLYDKLIKSGVQVWYDEKDLKPGDDIFEGINKGVNVYDKMILICSKESLNSWWVNQEMNRIFNKERDYQKANTTKLNLLIPITIDNEIFNWDGAKAESIKDKVIGDFTEWQDDTKFEQSLNQLIEALNVDRGSKNITSYL